MKAARGFGTGAESLAKRLGKLPVLVVGRDAIASSYFRAAAVRRAGESFAIMCLISDTRGTRAYDVASQVMALGDYDRQRMFFDSISHGSLDIGGGRKLSDVNVPDVGLRVGLSDLSRLADVLVVRSWCDGERQQELRGFAHPRVVRWYPGRDLGSWQPAARPDLVVVWAPGSPAEWTAIHTFALHDLHAPIVVVCSGGKGLSSRARYVDFSAPEVPTLLARALCVVDVSLDDPSWAQAFAARGLSVAATTTSGASEVTDGLAVYEPWSYRSIWAAALQALGQRRSTARESPPSLDAIERALEASQPATPEDRPLISIIIPTYNRHDDLVRILRKLQEQTYENFEVLVVNDGGESVADVAALDSRFRPIDRDENAGPFNATNVALGLARGKYIQIGADDDEWYPDHLARLVEALERTGAAVAHSNVVIRFESPVDGKLETTGYNASIFCHSLDHTDVYTSSPVAGNAYMFRKDVLDRVGTLDPSFVLADQEIQIRLAAVSDFVHVPHVTAEWLVRESGEQLSRNKQKDVPADMQRIFERHPATGSSYVAAMRERAIKNVLSRPEGVTFRPIISRVPPKL